VLAFAPSAAIDVYKNVSRDLQGDLKFNSNQFWIDSAKSQSGNAAGWGVGLFFALAMGTSAPVIITGLLLGVGVQLLWGALGYGDMAAAQVEKMQK
jgi:hypothetical protein